MNTSFYNASNDTIDRVQLMEELEFFIAQLQDPDCCARLGFTRATAFQCNMAAGILMDWLKNLQPENYVKGGISCAALVLPNA